MEKVAAGGVDIDLKRNNDRLLLGQSNNMVHKIGQRPVKLYISFFRFGPAAEVIEGCQGRLQGQECDQSYGCGARERRWGLIFKPDRFQKPRSEERRVGKECRSRRTPY